MSGVPQGSVLGPLLFVIFINDLDIAASNATSIMKFADDTKIAKTISDVSDKIVFQSCIDRLLEWSKDWGMEFNKSKCKIMHFGKQNPKFKYRMGDHELEATSQERDIGVIIQNDLKSSSQCHSAAARAKAVLGQLSRSFHFRDRHIFKRLYSTYELCASSCWIQHPRLVSL